MDNPIILAVAREAAATDWPLSSITLCAPMVTGEPLLVINWAKFDEEASEKPGGTKIKDLCRVPETVVPMPAMIAAETLAIEAAWKFGAWDIARFCWRFGHTGRLPPYVEALRDVAEAWRRQGWVSWYWRPMMQAPEIRQRQKHTDRTLDRWTMGRNEPLPPLRIPTMRPSSEHVIRLGRDDRTRRASPTGAQERATAKQIAYLNRLRADAGETDSLPAHLDKRQASAWIDRLTGTTQPSPSIQRKHVRLSANQWRLIDHLLGQLGRPCLPVNTMRAMSHHEAQSMIQELQKSTREAP